MSKLVKQLTQVKEQLFYYNDLKNKIVLKKLYFSVNKNQTFHQSLTFKLSC